MTTLDNQRPQILKSLDALDQLQTEKVLEYITELNQVTRLEKNYNKRKQEALRQISHALERPHQVNVGF